MLGVFIGEHDNKIDTKGRVSIPADFRRELEEGDPKWEPGKNASMAIVYGDHKRSHLEVFTLNDLMGVHKAIAKKPRGSAQRIALQKLYGAQTMIVTLDETGRIVLNAKLRTKLGLEDKAFVVGNLATFQIWHPDTYNSETMAQRGADEDFDPDADPSIYLPGEED